MISIAKPVIGKEEIDLVNQVLNSGMLAQGPKVEELERLFAEYCGTKYAVAVNSGTAAIHCALYAAGVGPGDEVITVPFSFIATVNPIIMLGAKPVFVDIDEETFNLDPSKLEKAITSKTKAVLPVHLYGQPADMDDIIKIAKKHKLAVIEDSCQAIGSKYKDKKAGSLGDIGCFSLYATKNIMCGEGGVVTTDSLEYATKIKQYRQHGMSAPYVYEGLGYNYRMTDLQAAIAIEQLKKVDNFNNARKKNAERYDELLSGAVIETPKIKEDRTHVFHQYTIKIKKRRDDLISYLKDNEINAGVYYPLPLHLIPHISKFGYEKGDFPVSERIVDEVISIPVHQGLDDDEIQEVALHIRKFFNA